MAPKIRQVTVTEAARNFADLVNRAFYRHETTILMKNGIAMAHIAPTAPAGIPASEARARWRLIPRLGAAEADALARDLAAARRTLPPARSPWD